MAQISKGTTYSDGMLVTSANLNAHVANATLLGGAISEQASADSVATTDLLLLNQGAGVGALKKATVAQVLANVATTGYVKTDGSVAMTGNLTLPATAPSSTQAVSRAWVEGYVSAGTLGYTPVNKAGDTMSGNLAFSGSATALLIRDPSAAMEASTKQYVDASASGKASAIDLTNHIGDKNNPHEVSATQLNLGAFENLTPATLGISTATQTALGEKVAKNGDTMTGMLSLPATAPTVGTHATSKDYVDAQRDTRVLRTGDTLSGTFIYNGVLQCTTAPSTGNDVVNKTYIDAIPKVVSSAWFYTNSLGTITTQTTFYLPVIGSRVAGTTTLTIDYSGLASKYKDASQPFFLTGQFIGIVGVTGITGKLYRIQSTDFANKKFTVTTTETTVINQSIQLSLVYDGTISGGSSLNVKSIYWNPTAPSKYYVNFWSDTVSKSKTNESPASVFSSSICGTGAEGMSGAVGVNYCSPAVCFDISGRVTYIDSTNYIDGYGATTMGCHIAYMRATTTGAVNALWNATFAITY